MGFVDLEVREFQERDAPALTRAIAESAEHLRPWMAWASEPMDDAQRARWIAEQRAGPDRVFGIWVDGEIAGGCGLHSRIGGGGLEIGYWIHPRFLRRGVATAAVRRLVDVAFADPSVDRVEIHHDVANEASGGVARAAGFEHVEDRSDGIAAPAETGVERVWRLTRRG